MHKLTGTIEWDRLPVVFEVRSMVSLYAVRSRHVQVFAILSRVRLTTTM